MYKAKLQMNKYEQNKQKEMPILYITYSKCLKRRLELTGSIYHLRLLAIGH